MPQKCGARVASDIIITHSCIFVNKFIKNVEMSLILSLFMSNKRHRLIYITAGHAQVTCQLGPRSSAYSISCSFFLYNLLIYHSNHHILHVLVTFTYDFIDTQLRCQPKTPESGSDTDQKVTLEAFLDRSTL